MVIVVLRDHVVARGKGNSFSCNDGLQLELNVI
jgi:hypothetical protein